MTTITAPLEIYEPLDIEWVNSCEEIVVLAYHSASDLCQATKPHLTALAREYGFQMAQINCDKHVPWFAAGAMVPSVTVFRRGRQVEASLFGAKTRKDIERYLAACGVIEQYADLS